MKPILPLLLLCTLVGCGSSDNASSTAMPRTENPSGPTLHITDEQFKQAFHCSGDLAHSTRDPVLLTPAFTSDDESFGFNYLRQFRELDIPHCSLGFTDRGFGDLQISAEYIVMAVRRMHADSGRKVILFGHQHGPLVELWALKFWPDLASKVSSYISLATPHNGTSSAMATCNGAGSCPPSVWQIAAGSKFITALNSRPLPVGLAYTSISTNFDEVIVPQPEASALKGGTQIVLQDICPGRPIEHFSILMDNLTYELVLDAINHPGRPADPANLPAAICSGEPFMPGILTPESGLAALQGFGGFLLGFAVAIPTQSVPAEPELQPYATLP